MRFPPRAALVLVLLAFGARSTAAEEGVLYASALTPLNSGLTIRKNVGEVRLTFAVTGQDHRPVLGLRREQVELREGEEAVRNTLDFRQESDLPLRAVVLIDSSDSVRKYLAAEEHIASEFARRLLRPGVDQALVGSFGTHLNGLEPLTGPDAVSHAVAGRTGELTALYDSLLACARTARERQPSTLARQAIVLLSDGEDNYSMASLQEVVATAQRSDVAIYAISTQRAGSRGDAVMRTIAAHTGGQLFTVTKPNQLQAVFDQIEQELRSGYVISFRPNIHDGRFHPLQVVVQGAGAVSVQARSGYWAPEE